MGITTDKGISLDAAENVRGFMAGAGSASTLGVITDKTYRNFFKTFEDASNGKNDAAFRDAKGAVGGIGKDILTAVPRLIDLTSSLGHFITNKIPKTNLGDLAENAQSVRELGLSEQEQLVNDGIEKTRKSNPIIGRQKLDRMRRENAIYNEQPLNEYPLQNPALPNLSTQSKPMTPDQMHIDQMTQFNMLKKAIKEGMIESSKSPAMMEVDRQRAKQAAIATNTYGGDK